MGRTSLIANLIRHALKNLRLRTSHSDALIQLAVLGVLVGLVTGLVIISFRLLIEGAQTFFLPDGDPENYEGLPTNYRILLPIAGAILIAAIFKLLAKKDLGVGVSYVMERLAYHHGNLEIRNFFLQYIGAAVAIISGQSLGREGPAIHLGATTGSLMVRQLGLPSNTVPTLIACGTAAAISASFNTPLAGVIFALEVVMMEYSLASFLPVILSAVSATAIMRIVFGAEVTFSIPNFQPIHLLELPYVMFLGVVTGIAAFVFIYLTKRTAIAGKDLSIWVRFTLAGTITGVLAIIAPQIMGIGYDTVTDSLANNISLSLLLIIFVTKLVVTACSVGLGLPAGLIAPTLVFGASLGGVLGILAQLFFPELASSPGMYALMGMAAMMGATLQAPLSALTAVFELTNSPNIVLPGMLAIVTAQLTASQLFGQDSIYRVLMQLKGLDYRYEPIVQALRRTGVANVMNRDIYCSPKLISRQEAKNLVTRDKEWIVIEAENPIVILPTSDLSTYLEDKEDKSEIDLMSIPAKRLPAINIDLRSTAYMAHEVFMKENAEALCITSTIGLGAVEVYGILTKDTLKSSYDV